MTIIYLNKCKNTDIPKYAAGLCVHASIMAFTRLFLSFESFIHESLTYYTELLRARELIHFCIPYCILNVVMYMESDK